nr:uncharacterized protein LOC109150750 isoform X1 [Ipomoea batatas]
MAKSDGTADNTPEKEARWGTWEELLLAGAVNRHGTKSWDSVADELQKRSSVPTVLLSPESCRLKYLDLKRRFSSGEVNGVDDECGERTEAAVPLLEELRRLRVAELRREVERYDISIVSLQLKVKTLTEERDRSLREDEKSDPAAMSENQEIRCEEKNEGDVEITPESDAGEPVTGDKDQQSMNESNSTDQKDANARTGTKDDGKHLEAILTGNVEDEPDKVKEGKPGREDSCNCSSNSVEKEPVHEVVKLKTEPVTDSTELLESVAESKGNEEGTKENSDVQSSASKSRKTGDADRSNRRSSSRDERANTNESPAVKEMPVEFQPLINFLEKIESNKHYSLFMRRLESQGLMKGMARALADRGLTAITFDTRGAGRSTGRASLTGSAEVNDVVSVCKWATSNLSANRIVLVGSSAGAAIAGSAVDKVEEVVGYVSLGYTFGFTASILFGGHQKAILQSPKPKLFVMGTKDGFTSVHQLEKKLSNAAGNNQTHLIEGVSHFQMEGPAFDAQMVNLILHFISSF